MQDLSQHIEAIIFTSENGISIPELKDTLNKIYGFDLDDTKVDKKLDEVRSRYENESLAIELIESGGGWQFMTKKIYHPTIAGYLNQKIARKLSSSAMEVLAIVAYKQPITKSEIEQIRGVNCDYTLHKLLEKELLEISGRKDAPGKPLLYITSAMFMDYFGINTLEDLPKLKELVPDENAEGTPMPQEGSEAIPFPSASIDENVEAVEAKVTEPKVASEEERSSPETTNGEEEIKKEN